jgi:ceramide glucosyltransferase
MKPIRHLIGICRIALAYPSAHPRASRSTGHAGKYRSGTSGGFRDRRTANGDGARRPRARPIRRLHLALTILWVAERSWKWWRVRRFFRQPAPPPARDPAHELVSIIQPILSGDPTLSESLAATLRARSAYPREWLWLVDDDDAEGLRVCRALVAAHPARTIRLLTVPPPLPQDRRNPKTLKLIAGAATARGTILCVLDDDTRLPDGGLEALLPALDLPGIGLAYGLPYYVSFTDRWSALVAAFVNSHSLPTYIPPLALTAPFTINGMCYATRRETLAAVGGFAGLEGTLADDFAVAQRFRAAGYGLAQTPLRHAIGTRIAGPRHYAAIIARWFVFPRESILRHVAPRDHAIVGALVIAPTLLPLASLLLTLARPSRRAVALLAAGHAVAYAVFAHTDRTYLGGATPPRWHALVPLIQTILPVQVGAAFLLPQRIEWRGHIMQVERGGGFRFVRRRAG